MGSRKQTDAELIAELRAEAAVYMEIARRISLRIDREYALAMARQLEERARELEEAGEQGGTS
jgi:hypothetical protein